MNRTTLIALASLLPLAPTLRADEQPRVISTSGESIVYVVPDEVSVTFGVQSFDPDLDKAKSANDTNSAKLVKAIRDVGVEEKYIATDRLEVELRYRDSSFVPDIQGYIVRRNYAVKLKDVKNFEKLVDSALKNGANQLLGVDFRTTELRKYRDQARKMAIGAAKEKAVALASELEQGVGVPRTITEGGGGIYFGGGYARSGRYGGMSQNSMQEVAAPAADSGESLPLGQIAVQAQVSVTFELTPGPTTRRAE